MLYFCIADGMADFLPDAQDYYACESVDDMREIIRSVAESFNDDYPAHLSPFNHVMPNHVWQIVADRGASSLNWRLCVARVDDRVLDVIGMTEEEYEQQSA